MLKGTTLEVFAQNAKTPLWSSQPILDNPSAVVEVHLAFLQAGARILMTSTYQAAVSTFKEAGYSEIVATDTMLKSVHLANEARESFIRENSGEIVKIALSLGPFGATLSPPQEFAGYYTPPYGPMRSSETGNICNSFPTDDTEGEEKSIEALARFHLERLLVFARDPETWRQIDIVAFETVPLVREAFAIRKAMLDLNDTLAVEGADYVQKPWWISFVLPGGKSPQKNTEGQYKTVQDIVSTTLSAKMAGGNREVPRPSGIGINCTAPEFIPTLVNDYVCAVESLDILGLRPWLVLYPDAGDVYDTLTRSWLIPSKDAKRSWAVDLKNVVHVAQTEQQSVWGGLVIGGCCRTDPDLIQRLREQLSPAV
ncbi:hypothetical protein C0995_002202 [Termitomyces sp. Mi166|nr:hypothetical protein C0995_002202 [Termitomyces sp. Mi166\